MRLRFALVLQVKEISQPDADSLIIARREIVTLGVAIDIAQTIVVATLKQEVSHLRDGIFHAEACRNTVVEFILHLHRVLCHDAADTVAGIALVEIEVALCRLTDIRTQLRSCIEEEVESFLFLAPRQVCQKGHLDVVDGTAVVFGRARCSVDDGIVVDVLDILFPAHLCVVHLQLYGADGGEILLYGVSQSYAAGKASQAFLLYFRRELDVGDIPSRRRSHRQRVAMLTDLGSERPGQSQEEEKDKQMLHVR